MGDFHNMTSITLLHCSTLPENWHLLFSGQSRTLPRRLSLSCQQAGVCNGWDHLLLKVLDHIKKIMDHLKLVVSLTTSTLCFSYSWQPQPCVFHVLDNLNHSTQENFKSVQIVRCALQRAVCSGHKAKFRHRGQCLSHQAGNQLIAGKHNLRAVTGKATKRQALDGDTAQHRGLISY